MKTAVTIISLCVFVFLLVPNISAQSISQSDVCKESCLSEKCYTYLDCKPIEGECKSGNCCQGKCQIINPSSDNKINHINDLIAGTLEKVENIEKSMDKASLNLFGTEYMIGDNATVFLQILDDDKLPINDAFCYLDIYYPDKSLYIDDGIMMYLLGSDGLYYYDTVIPNKTGVYMLSVRCDFIHNLTYFTSSKDSQVITTFPDTNYGNLNYMGVGHLAPNNSYSSFVAFNLSNASVDNINNVTLSLYEVGFVSNPLNMSITRVLSDWNETNITFNNQPPICNLTCLETVYPSIGWNHFDVTQIVKYWLNGTYPNYGFFLNYTNGKNNGLGFNTRNTFNDYTPRLTIIYNTTSYISEVRGSGELHVSGKLQDYFDAILNNQTTISNKLDSMQTDIDNILVNQSNLKQIIYDTNQSLYDKILEIKTDISTLQSYVISVNDTVLQTNQTIMTKLYGVQQELANITNLTETAIDLIFDTNQTIMSYLFEMNYTLWQSIYDVWNNLNFTNVTLAITTNLTGLPKETYLYFQTVEETLQHNNDSCIANGTIHRKEILVEKCVAGDCFNVTKQIDEYCQFGCSQGQCNPEPQTRFSLMIIAILLMLGFSYGIYQVARRT